MSSSNTSILVPVSFGELFDKCSILQIKRERITNKEKVACVEKELHLLMNMIQEKRFLASANVSPLITQLKEINETLWDIEDKIRVKEDQKVFDEEFILLARSVYQTNDERNRIKHRINTYLNSDIIDIKEYHSY